MLWYQAFASVPVSARESMLDALRRFGVEAAPLGDASPKGIGLAFVSSASDTDLEAVGELTHSGVNRVLVFLDPRSTSGPDVYWRLLAAGASDVLPHRVASAEIAAARIGRWAEVDRLVGSKLVLENLVGESPAWIRVLRQVVEVACFTTAPVLLMGESGTGKELLARLIHTLDRRPDKKALVVTDCTTIVPELAGSEFFGHERGAFTTALQAREGAFALAHGGTLFLDEVGELPRPLQSQLLRAVQEKTYKRVGSNQWRTTDFRLVSATNRDLYSEVQQGAFRRDLFHRLASWTIRVPPLRDRHQDVLTLARHFLAELLPQRPVPDIDDGVRRFLLTRTYEGNVRELRQLLVRISGRHVGPGPVTIGDIPEEERIEHPPTATGTNLEDAVRYLMARGSGLREIAREASTAAVRIAVSENQGNLQKAARLLGVTDRALQLRSRSNGGGAQVN